MVEAQQELMFKFTMFEQQIQQLQQQMQAVEQAIREMTNISHGLEELRGKKDKEIMAPIGRGIFVQAKLLSEELMVDVGDKTFVKKSVPDTKEIIDNQLGKLEEIKNELDSQLGKINDELTQTILSAQGPAENTCSCENCEDDSCEGEECNCDEEGCDCKKVECESEE